MKKIILISIVLWGCSKTPTTSTTNSGVSNTFAFNNITYTLNTTQVYKTGNNYKITIGYYPITGITKDLSYFQILYNPINRDSTYLDYIYQDINGNSILYSRYGNTGRKDSKGNDIILSEYKKSPNIVLNTNGTFTINDSFKCYKPTAIGVVDTTKYTLYVNNVTTK